MIEIYEALEGHKMQGTIWGLEDHLTLCSCGEKISVKYSEGRRISLTEFEARESGLMEHYEKVLIEKGFALGE